MLIDCWIWIRLGLSGRNDCLLNDIVPYMMPQIPNDILQTSNFSRFRENLPKRIECHMFYLMKTLQKSAWTKLDIVNIRSNR